MPLVTMFSVSDGDVNSNPNCIFIYADHRKQSGRPFINNRFRKSFSESPESPES